MKNKTCKQIIQIIQNLKIRNKIVLFYISLIVVSILLSMLIYNRTNIYYLNKKITELTISEIKSDNRNLELLIEDINNYSKIFLANQTLQMVLKENNNLYKNYKALDRELAEFINFNNKVSSIYIFKNDGKKYYTDKVTLKKINLTDIQNMPWYNKVVKKHGGYIININGDGLVKEKNKNYLTFFRTINNLDNQQPIGLMMINISQDVIEKTLGLKQQKNTMFVIENTNNQNSIIFHKIKGINQNLYLTSLHKKNQLWNKEKLHNNQIIITGINNTNYGWKLLRITYLKGQKTQINIFKIAILVIILLNCILIFFGSFFISKLITTPISKLLDSMKHVEQGHFFPVNIKTYNDEIGMLKNGYNFMINEIQTLIQKIINEQKTLKKAEFKIIMEQIKPHFLYNTLDSISSLIILNRNDEAYKSLRALANFYRTSLSKGKSMITIKDEISIIKNYLFIQKIRYGNLFNVTYHIEPEVLNYKIPKLILQPLVENSIYHGIRPLGGNGIINISIKKNNSNIILAVSDNGVGIPNEKIKSLNNDFDNSVGIHATKKKLQVLYGNKSNFIIESNNGTGTNIIIKLPWEVETSYGQKTI